MYAEKKGEFKVLVVLALLVVLLGFLVISSVFGEGIEGAVVGKIEIMETLCSPNNILCVDDTSGEFQEYATIEAAYNDVNPGDTIYIKEGIYRETLNLTKSGNESDFIKIEAYLGDEGKVIINAAELITNWTLCTSETDCENNSNYNNIYYAIPGFEIKQLFQNGARLNSSRYPDEGWNYPTNIGSNQKMNFYDNSLTKPNNYFNGSIANIKTRLWTINQILVDNYNNISGEVNLTSDTDYNISIDYGYYFTNIVGEINEAGEWAYDYSNGRLYYWPINDLENIEASHKNYCIYAYYNQSYNDVSDLTCKYVNLYGIYLYKGSHISVKRNTIDYAYTFGIYDYGSNHSQIVNNTIRYANHRGISDNSASVNTTVRGNYLYAIGAENYGDDLINGVGHGIFISGNNSKIINNSIDGTAYNSIFLSGSTSNREVEYNFINNSCLSLADGGGFYTGSHSDNEEYDYIRYNIFENIFGYLGGVKAYDCNASKDSRICVGAAYGIYIDEQGNNRMIANNTIVNSYSAGIFLHYTNNNVISDNTVYGGADYQIIFSGKNETGFVLENNTLFNNTMYSTNSSQKTFYLTINYSDVNFGDSNLNYFYNPYKEKNIRIRRYINETAADESFTLSGWQNLSGNDSNSKKISTVYKTENLNNDLNKDSQILINPSMQTTLFSLGNTEYCSIDGDELSGSIRLDAFESRILLKCFCNNDYYCNNNENVTTCPQDCEIDVITPTISFGLLTPENNSFQSNANINVNISTNDFHQSINDSRFHSAFIDFDNSLILWMRFNNETSENETQIIDWSDNENNGTVFGNTFYNLSGKMGKAFEFDGVDDYIDLGMDSSLNFRGSFTVSVWIKTNITSDNHQIIGKYNSSGGKVQWRLYQDNEYIFFDLFTTATNHIRYRTGPIDLSRWTNIVGKYDNSTLSLEIYINGVNQSLINHSVGTFTGPQNSTDSTVIGMLTGGSGPTWYFDGLIDDVLILNRTLSQEEILALYNTQSNKLYHNFTDLTEGAHIFKAYAQDVAGNVNETEERQVTISTTIQETDSPGGGGSSSSTHLVCSVGTIKCISSLQYQECLQYGTTNKWSETLDVPEGYQCEFGKIVELEEIAEEPAELPEEEIPPALPQLTEETVKEAPKKPSYLWLYITIGMVAVYLIVFLLVKILRKKSKTK